MKKASPTAMTLKRLRADGYIAGVVEQTIRGKGIVFKRDYLGCIDIIGVHSGGTLAVIMPDTVGIQACIGGDHARRRAKAISEPRLKEWLGAGNSFEIWSWRKAGARDKRKTWTLRRDSISLSDLAAAPEGANKAAAPAAEGANKAAAPAAEGEAK